MNETEYIKSRVERLYRTNPNVHVSVSKSRPRICVESAEARLVGVYKNIFQIEAREEGKLPVRYSFQYGELLVGQVSIQELDYVPTASLLNKN